MAGCLVFMAQYQVQIPSGLQDHIIQNFNLPKLVFVVSKHDFLVSLVGFQVMQGVPEVNERMW